MREKKWNSLGLKAKLGRNECELPCWGVMLAGDGLLGGEEFPSNLKDGARIEDVDQKVRRKSLRRKRSLGPLRKEGSRRVA